NSLKCFILGLSTVGRPTLPPIASHSWHLGRREAVEFRKTKLCATNTKCRGRDGVGSAEPRRLRFCGFSLAAAPLLFPTTSLQKPQPRALPFRPAFVLAWRERGLKPWRRRTTKKIAAHALRCAFYALSKILIE